MLGELALSEPAFSALATALELLLGLGDFFGDLKPFGDLRLALACGERGSSEEVGDECAGASRAEPVSKAIGRADGGRADGGRCDALGEDIAAELLGIKIAL